MIEYDPTKPFDTGHPDTGGPAMVEEFRRSMGDESPLAYRDLEKRAGPRMTGLMRAAIAEALTLLTLFGVAMPLKYWAGLPQAVSVVGPIHGFAFIVFLWFIARSWGEGLIDWIGALRLFIGAFIPFGGLVNERWLRRRSELI